MLYDLLIILVCLLWCLLCVAILLYLNLDKLRTQAHRIWKLNRESLADWYDLTYSSRKPHQQVMELIEVRSSAACEDPEWWNDFVSCYNESAQRYCQRLNTPVFRQLGTLLCFMEMPLLSSYAAVRGS